MENAQIEAYINRLLDERPGVVFALFKSYGVDLEPTPENLLIAYYQFGEPFAEDLQLLLNAAKYTGEQTEETEEINQFDWNDIFSKGLEILTSGATIYNAFKSDPNNPDEPGEPQQPEKVFGLPKGLFIGVSVVAGLLILFLIIKASKQ